ncbi:hypothetical protein AYI69_g2745 [Smittium culicis]|uniref:Mitochondrial protein n=1 Tax=Smittium culicis TaxID=133412 RepID=A0A1R1YLP6_9FUNG|nr:hypothetical protein AYI69_g2745 [Smittium culicis]
MRLIFFSRFNRFNLYNNYSSDFQFRYTHNGTEKHSINTPKRSYPHKSFKDNLNIGSRTHSKQISQLSDPALPKEAEKKSRVEKLVPFADQNDVDEWIPEIEKNKPNHNSSSLENPLINLSKKPIYLSVDKANSGNITKTLISEPKKISTNGNSSNKDFKETLLDQHNVRNLGSISDAEKTYESAKLALGGSIHPLNTYEVINILKDANFSPKRAESLMNCIRDLLVKQIASMMSKTCLSEQVENNSYEIKAAIQQLRIEMLLMHKNSHSIIQSESSSVARELEILSQQIKEEIMKLRSNISIEMNNRRYERFDSIKDLEVHRQEMETTYYYLLGEVKTDIEATKLNIIRKGFLTILITGLVIIIFIPKKNKNSLVNDIALPGNEVSILNPEIV